MSLLQSRRRQWISLSNALPSMPGAPGPQERSRQSLNLRAVTKVASYLVIAFSVHFICIIKLLINLWVSIFSSCDLNNSFPKISVGHEHVQEAKAKLGHPLVGWACSLYLAPYLPLCQMVCTLIIPPSLCTCPHHSPRQADYLAQRYI